MSLRRAKTVDEYVDWVRSALFEVADLRECLMFETEGMARIPAFLEPLEDSIRQLHTQMREGNYRFGREDLPFMDISHLYGDEIPFNTLLKQINETHRKGLDVEEAED